jgi:thiol-disulfide isomerase/thioredoxin
MRYHACFAILAVFAIGAQADDKPVADKKETKSLKTGDPAPLLKADQWLQGTEVKEFSKGKVYVVEFWAVWCGPCIVMMPHMAELQAEYRGKGTIFIGYSVRDSGENPRNKLETVTEFVKKRGPKLGYTFAYSDDRANWDAWMKAAGQGGIPCSFVVDQSGKIAYIGHPMFLDLVLPKVAAGKWTAKDLAALDEARKEVDGVFKALFGPDANAGLKALADLEAKYPSMSKIPYFAAPKINLLVKSKQYDDAKKFAEGLLAKALKQDDSAALRSLSGVLRSEGAKDQKDLSALAIKAAEAALKVAGEKDWIALMNLAETYFALSDKDKAKEFGAKAIAAAETPQQKQNLEKRVKAYDEAK